jgi:uncharacterized membrane protein YeaQ/YmgE (transglycosylase-associated protein family)
MAMDPVLVFILVLIIGIAVGLLFPRFRPTGWLTRQVAGRRADLTSALVGIAGAFIGFHIVALASITAGILAMLIGAVIGAILVVWGWRELRI